MQSLSSRHGTSGTRCNDGVGWLTPLLGGGGCWLVCDYFWPCYSGIETEEKREGDERVRKKVEKRELQNIRAEGRTRDGGGGNSG